MINHANCTGINSDETLRCNQELDTLFPFPVVLYVLQVLFWILQLVIVLDADLILFSRMDAPKMVIVGRIRPLFVANSICSYKASIISSSVIDFSNQTRLIAPKIIFLYNDYYFAKRPWPHIQALH